VIDRRRGRSPAGGLGAGRSAGRGTPADVAKGVTYLKTDTEVKLANVDTAHAQAMAEQADRHAVTLESILAVLRSTRLEDRASRATALDLASAALIELRSTTDQQLGTMLEPVDGAFARLRTDLRPLARFGGLDVQFVEPPTGGRALPGEEGYLLHAWTLSLEHPKPKQRLELICCPPEGLRTGPERGARS